MKIPISAKRNFLLYAGIFIVSGSFGCDWFSTSPNEAAPKHLWKTKTYTTGALDGAFPITVYDNRIVVMMAQADLDDSKIIGLDAKDGKILWQWEDYYMDKEADGIYKTALYQNKLVFASGGRHYCIDAETGKTVWRNRVNNASTSSIVQFGSKYYYAGDSYNSTPWRRGIFMVDTETGENTEVYTPAPQIGLKTPAVFLSDEGDIMLAIAESRENEQNKFHYSQSFVLYNITKKTVVYSVTPVNGTYGSFGFRENIVKDGKFYSDIGKGLVCLDVKTGKEIWRRYFFGDFLFSNFIVEGGVLYANCEDRRRYALDANTGDVKWQEDNTGICSPIFYMNGVLYYIGGGDGKLYAVDAATGKAIWKISAPMDSRYGFSSSMPGGADGRIYCCDHYYAYCYQAAR